MDTITWVALAALVIKVVGVIKSVGKDNNAAITQALVWIIGVGAVLVAGQSHFAGGLVFSGVKAADFNFWDSVLAGMALSSVGSFGYDLKKSFDNTDSASEPALLKKAA